MSIVRIGSNDRYANGWDMAFGGKKNASAVAGAKKKGAKKAAPKKAAPKKKAKKK